jgi:predicted transcriptional regulator
MMTKEQILEEKAIFFADLGAPHLSENDKFEDLISKMRDYSGDVAVVTNESNDKYAIITKNEILGAVDEQDIRNSKIKDIPKFQNKINMNINNSAKETDPLKDVIRKLKTESLKPIPIINSNNAAIGIVTQNSISKGLDIMLNK